MKQPIFILCGAALLVIVASGVGFVASKQQALQSSVQESKNVLGNPTGIDFEAYEAITLQLGDDLVQADLAISTFERVRGLSGRTHLAEQEGLFFVFSHNSKHGIWMKDMLFAIDIIWLDQEFRVVDIVERATPESFPQVFEPREDARYVLEVPSGFTKAANVTINDTMIITDVVKR